jgi:hypothetical protein
MCRADFPAKFRRFINKYGTFPHCTSGSSLLVSEESHGAYASAVGMRGDLQSGSDNGILMKLHSGLGQLKVRRFAGVALRKIWSPQE